MQIRASDTTEAAKLAERAERLGDRAKGGLTGFVDSRVRAITVEEN